MISEYPVQKINLSNGETLAYRTVGDSDNVLLLLHGNMSSSVHFQPLMAELASDYQVIALDLAGFGESTYHVAKDRLHLYAIEVAEFIEKKELQKVTVLGWSTGGGIALELAALLPTEITHVYLLDSVGVKGLAMFKKDEHMQPILTERLGSRAEIENDPVQVQPILTAYRNQDKEFIRYVWNNSIYFENQPNKSEYERYLDAILKQRNLVDIDVALVNFNMTDESNGVVAGSNQLKKVKCPVTIFHGKNDLIVPLEEAQATAKILGEQSQLIVFHEGGHSLLTDDLKGLADEIRKTYCKGAM